MLTESARVATRSIVEPVARALASAGATPNAVTVLGCLLHVGVAALLASGHVVAGGVALALAAAFDGLDGSLARATGRVTRGGAFLDSTLDRVSEILVFLGLLVHAQRVAPGDVVVVYLAAVASLMVSYTRARSEALDCATKAGLFGRMERTVVLVAALLLGRPALGLWVVAIGATATAALRVVDALRRAGRESA